MRRPRQETRAWGPSRRQRTQAGQRAARDLGSAWRLYRRTWIRDRLESLAGLFGVEIAAFAVMSNHLHVILRSRPDVVALWSDQEVARQWLALFPGRVGTKPDPASALPAFAGPMAEQAGLTSPDTPANPPGREPTDAFEQAVAMLTADPALMATIRGRLSSLSWFMRALAEPIARRANREDHCTGRFWEGRFQSQRLLDEAALLACSVYVDLNPIRGGLADRPESSELTSAHERIMALFQDISTQPGTAAVDASPVAEAEAPANSSATALVEEGALVLVEESPAALTGPGAVENAGQDTADVPLRRDGWLSPIELNERAEPLTTAMATPQTAAAATKRIGSGRSRRASDRGLLPMTLESYLTLLDWTGRQLRAGTHGVIPPALASILDRLQVSAESWLETVARFGRQFHRAVGLADNLKAEAQRLGVNWLHGLRWSQVAFAPAPCPVAD